MKRRELFKFAPAVGAASLMPSVVLGAGFTPINRVISSIESCADQVKIGDPRALAEENGVLVPYRTFITSGPNEASALESLRDLVVDDMTDILWARPSSAKAKISLHWRLPDKIQSYHTEGGFWKARTRIAWFALKA